MRKRINIKTIVAIILIGVVLLYLYYKNNSYDKNKNIFSEEEILVNQEVSDEDDKLIVQNEKKEDTEIIVVYITGEVKNWGVVELNKGARIIDAVDKAGGFTENADQGKVNLAYILSDGVKIYIPSKNQEINTEYIIKESGDNVVTEENEMPNTNNQLVNINNATQTELETLPGIGPSIALKIISHREENGKFSNIDEIKNVSGIGENKFERIKELICV